MELILEVGNHESHHGQFDPLASEVSSLVDPKLVLIELLSLQKFMHLTLTLIFKMSHLYSKNIFRLSSSISICYFFCKAICELYV